MNSQHHREANFTAPRPMRKSPLPLGLLPESVIRHTQARPPDSSKRILLWVTVENVRSIRTGRRGLRLELAPETTALLPRPRAIALSLHRLRKCAPDGTGVAQPVLAKNSI
jgi:hypothetical protein